MNYFINCSSIEEAKTTFRELAKQHHPDIGGDAETFKQIRSQFENFIKEYSEHIFQSSNQEYDISDVYCFSEILKKIIDFNLTIEIIGYWIYCFNSYEYKDKLLEYGFWFSKKHKAWIFSGETRHKYSTKLTKDEIANKYGYSKIKEHKEQKKIGA